MDKAALGASLIDPKQTVLFIPPELKKFKLDLFCRIGRHIESLGGQIVQGDFKRIERLDRNLIPIIGCSIPFRDTIKDWRANKRDFIYWDRGYCRRVFATWLPKGDDGGYYRWHVNAFQMGKIRNDLPDDRWKAANTKIEPWKKDGKHIVIAAPSKTYTKFHGCENWVAETIDVLARTTKRQLVIRDKESKRPLSEDLFGAHALVTHGSNSAVESVFMGCPVFVDQTSAAALVGKTSLKDIESPLYPDRDAWLRSLCYSQFNERELVDGTLWKLIT